MHLFPQIDEPVSTFTSKKLCLPEILYLYIIMLLTCSQLI